MISYWIGWSNDRRVRRSTQGSLVSYPREKIYLVRVSNYETRGCTQDDPWRPQYVPVLYEHKRRRYGTSTSGGDTVLEQLLLNDSTYMLTAHCAERWASAPTCLVATAPLSFQQHSRSDDSFLCATRVQRELYTVRTLVDHHESHGSHTREYRYSACAFSVLCTWLPR